MPKTCPAPASHGPNTRPKPPKAPTLNAIAAIAETSAERTERQLRTCRELTELGMEVARAAAREAISNLDAPREHRMPGASLPPVCPTADPGLLFARISHAVRQTMMLETRIAAGTLYPVHTPSSPQSPRPDPRDRAGRPGFRPEQAERLEDETCTVDNRPIPEILAAIRQVLGTAPAQATPAQPPRRTAPARLQPTRPASAHPSQNRGTDAKSQPPPRPG